MLPSLLIMIQCWIIDNITSRESLSEFLFLVQHVLSMSPWKCLPNGGPFLWLLNMFAETYAAFEVFKHDSIIMCYYSVISFHKIEYFTIYHASMFPII